MAEAKNDDALPIRQAGTSSLSLPVIGIGSWSFGGDDKSYWGTQAEADSQAVADAALACGPTFFDSAEAYNNGDSESAVAAALAKSKHSGNAILGSKILPDHCGDAASIREHCEASLKRFAVESMDIYHVHWPIPTEQLKTCFETLAALQAEGKIKHIAVSNFGVKQLSEAIAAGAKIAVNQLMYNLVSRGIELEIGPLCQQHGIGIIAYSPLMQGLLTGRYSSFDELPVMRTRLRHFKGTRPHSRHGGPGCEDELLKAVQDIKRIAESNSIPMTELCIAWVLANPAITCVIPGARNVEQLRSNYAAGRRTLSADVVQQLNDATQPVLDILGGKIDYYEGDENQRIW